MAITIDVQSNPNRSAAGKLSADATIINSGLTGTVLYQIRRRDRADFGVSTGENVIQFASSTDYATCTQVVAITAAQLQVILPFRTELQVRCSNNAGSTWTDWSSFKTRDKRYQSPDAITQLTDDGNVTAADLNSRTLNITNSAKATQVETAAGATVTNTDTGYVGTSSIVTTDAGATVTNSDTYQTPGGPITIS
jgi:hypothetical protein